MYRNDLKFSLWCDFVERSFLEHEFVELLEQGIVNAATSNPAIFKSAFLGSPAYEKAKKSIQGQKPKEIYEALAIEDIRLAASKLLPLYEKGDDGFISIEVDPFLCDDANATIEEGRRLFKAIGYPNVMIKIPATSAGFEAMETLLSEKIHVNATLIFSPTQTQKCLGAFKKAQDKIPSGAQAVISIFVSRFDRKLDPQLKNYSSLISRVGIMNALSCYKIIEQAKIPNVRALFASTGVKGDALGLDYYIKELLVPRAINTAPLETIKAFITHGKKAMATPIPSDESLNLFFHSLAQTGVDIQKIYDELMSEGLSSFKEAFVEILKSLEEGNK